MSVTKQSVAGSRNERAKSATKRDSDVQLLPQDHFRHRLSQERKRSERSRKHLLLMLIGHVENAQASSHTPALATVATILSSAIRDTDIAGWFDTGSMLGVIYTEFGDSNLSHAAKAVEARLTGVLQHTLSAQQISTLQISFYVFPDDWAKSDGSPTNSAFYPDLAEAREKRRLSLVVKRSMDIAGSACALVLLSPVFLILAALIKMTSRGPVFFLQERAGQYGVRFTLLKFRSMHVSNDHGIHKKYVTNFIAGKASTTGGTQENGGVYKITNDPRVTWLGNIMRRTSLDEIPQFWNVLRGEMSLVGPRPPIPYELEAYDLWHRTRLLGVKPGITGLWQVRGRSKTTFDEMVRLDLQYSRTWSPILDMKILLQTPRAVFSGDGAY